MNAIVGAVFNPIFRLLFAVGLLAFVWGIIEFLWDMTRGGKGEKGKQHMLYGILGMFVMASAYAIINVLAGMICNGGVGNCYR